MLLSFLLLMAAEDCVVPGTYYRDLLIERGAKRCEDPKNVMQKPTRKATAAEISAAKAYFNEVLKDGNSARWRFEGVWDGGYVCGTVNAKNSYGAYTGWRRFWYHDGAGDVSEDDRNNWYGTPVPCLLPSLVSRDEVILR